MLLGGNMGQLALVCSWVHFHWNLGQLICGWLPVPTILTVEPKPENVVRSECTPDGQNNPPDPAIPTKSGLSIAVCEMFLMSSHVYVCILCCAQVVVLENVLGFKPVLPHLVALIRANVPGPLSCTGIQSSQCLQQKVATYSSGTRWVSTFCARNLNFLHCVIKPFCGIKSCVCVDLIDWAKDLVWMSDVQTANLPYTCEDGRASRSGLRKLQRCFAEAALWTNATGCYQMDFQLQLFTSKLIRCSFPHPRQDLLLSRDHPVVRLNRKKKEGLRLQNATKLFSLIRFRCIVFFGSPAGNMRCWHAQANQDRCKMDQKA